MIPGNPLLALHNVICTPHVAAATSDVVLRVSTTSAHNVIAYLRGGSYDPDNLANSAIIQASGK